MGCVAPTSSHSIDLTATSSTTWYVNHHMPVRRYTHTPPAGTSSSTKKRHHRSQTHSGIAAMSTIMIVDGSKIQLTVTQEPNSRKGGSHDLSYCSRSLNIPDSRKTGSDGRMRTRREERP